MAKRYAAAKGSLMHAYRAAI